MRILPVSMECPPRAYHEVPNIQIVYRLADAFCLFQQGCAPEHYTAPLRTTLSLSPTRQEPLTKFSIQPHHAHGWSGGLHFWPVVSNDLVSFFSVSPLHFFVSWIVIHIGLVLYLSIALSNLHLLFFLLVWYGQLDVVICPGFPCVRTITLFDRWGTPMSSFCDHPWHNTSL